GVGSLVFSGYGGGSHAALWSLSTGSVIDLHSFLPPEYQTGGLSNAYYVDPFGNVYGQASVSGGSVGVPVIWMPVPEASSLSMFAAFALFVSARRCIAKRTANVAAAAERIFLTEDRKS